MKGKHVIEGGLYKSVLQQDRNIFNLQLCNTSGDVKHPEKERGQISEHESSA